MTFLPSQEQRITYYEEHMDIYHLSRETKASDMSSLEVVICCDEERLKLENEVALGRLKAYEGVPPPYDKMKRW